MPTGIQWTDETWNPTVGCEHVSPGCDNCYAKELHDRRHKALHAGKRILSQYAEPFEHLQMMPDRLDKPLHWREPRRVFVNSVSDLFHRHVTDAFRDDVFAVMAIAKQHTFQILTKRPERMLAYLTGDRVRHRIWQAADTFCRGSEPRGGKWRNTYDVVPVAVPAGGPQGCYVRDWPLSNVHLGVSVENQEAADKRIPVLLKTPAALRFLSCEPLLGPVNLKRVRHFVGNESFVTFDALRPGSFDQWSDARIDWVIAGGESGNWKAARPCAVAWIRSIVGHCRACAVPPHVKQLGRWIVGDHAELPRCVNRWLFQNGDQWEPGVVGEHNRQRPADAVAFSLFDSHGGDWDEWPDDLRVREFPMRGAA